MNKSHPWAQHLLDVEVPDAIQYKGYQDRNHWLVWAFDLTGDVALMRHAIDSLLNHADTSNSNFADKPKGPNESRESACYYAILFAKLERYMTAAEAQQYRDRLWKWADYIFSDTTVGDSDEIIGHYFALAAIDKFTGSSFCQRPECGLMRSEIRRYIAVAKGGCWPESSEYNLGTLGILCLGLSAVGFDEFPEFKQLLGEVTEHLRWSVTPDLKDCIQWGDVQNRDSLGHERFKWIALLGQLCGLGCDPTGQGLALLAALCKGLPINHLNMMLSWRAIFCGFDPVALSSAPAYEPPLGTHVATGMGMVIRRTATRLVQMHFPVEKEWIDHATPMFGDIRIWENGEWVIDHPISYSRPPETYNVGLMAGLGQMHERKVVVASGVVVGGTWGPRSQMTPPFVDGWTRSIDLDRLTVTDTFAGLPPVLEGYHDFERQLIAKQLALWAQVWHPSEEPTETADGFAWKTAKGTPIRLVTNAARRVKRHVEYADGQWGWQVAFLSDEPKATIETKIVIGTEPPVVVPASLEARVETIERQIEALRKALE